ncbi:ABC transporter permease [Candidatus Uabimicrobium sp. HlEnr_7]|uniref:ABC transporter permease n=1 Tax=Candidatus Uabimicrobium helgolandensis TaxID=3095367 RepID=UPI003555CDFE
MPIYKMAWRNIWRNKRRTGLSIAVVGFCIGILILFIAIINGLQEQIIKSSVNTFTSYIQVHRKGFDKEKSLAGFIEKTDDMQKQIGKLPSVEGVTARILSSALISYENYSSGCLVVGIEPSNEKKVTFFYRGIKEGHFLEDQDEDTILITKTIAQRISAKLNSEITIMVQGYNGSLEARNLKIKGILDLGNPELNQNLVIVTRKTAGELTGYKSQKISELAIRLKGNKGLQKTTNEIKNILKKHKSFYGELVSEKDNDLFVEEDIEDNFIKTEKGIEFEKEFEVLSWQDLLKAIVQFIQFENSVVHFILMIVYVAVILILFNVFIMSIMERKKEFGIMKAVGTKSSQLIFMVCIESFAIVIIGIIVGSAIGITASLTLYFFPLEIASAVDIFNQGMLRPQVLAILNMKSLLLPIAGALITGLIAPLLACREITKLNPAEAMHSS